LADSLANRENQIRGPVDGLALRPFVGLTVSFQRNLGAIADQFCHGSYINAAAQGQCRERVPAVVNPEASHDACPRLCRPPRAVDLEDSLSRFRIFEEIHLAGQGLKRLGDELIDRHGPLFAVLRVRGDDGQGPLLKIHVGPAEPQELTLGVAGRCGSRTHPGRL